MTEMVKKAMQLNPFILLILISLTLLIIFPTAYSQTDEDLLMEKGINAVNDSRYKEAITYFDKILESDPENVQALINKGTTLGFLKKHSDAIYYFDKVLEIEPNKISALYSKGTALSYLEEYNEALYYFDKVLEIEPNNISALFNMGTTLSYLKEYDDALYYFDKILESDPENLQALVVKTSFSRRDVFRVYGQFSIWDSNGNLVSYIEEDVYNYDKLNLNLFLNFPPRAWNVVDLYHNPAIVTVTSENVTERVNLVMTDVELLTIKQSADYVGINNVFSKTVFHHPDPDLASVPILTAITDGYPVTSGDTYEFLWRVLRPFD